MEIVYRGLLMVPSIDMSQIHEILWISWKFHEIKIWKFQLYVATK